MCLVMTPLVLETTSAIRRNPVPYLLAAVNWSEFRVENAVQPEHPRVQVNRVLLWKSLIVSAAMIVFFFLGWPVPMVALVAGARC
jgi:Na+/H+ antiporter NhaD/arsenite permease-like protein